MKRMGILILALTSALSATPARADGLWSISEHTAETGHGGDVIGHMIYYAQQASAGKRIIAPLKCYSACTEMLAFSANVCADPYGAFYFHLPFNNQTGKRWTEAQALALYPPAVRRVIQAHGHLSATGWLKISAGDFDIKIGGCDE